MLNSKSKRKIVFRRNPKASGKTQPYEPLLIVKNDSKHLDTSHDEKSEVEVDKENDVKNEAESNMTLHG